MFTSEKITRAAMMGKLDDAEFDIAMDVALAVERGVTCPITGEIMDTRTAIAFRVHKENGWVTEIVTSPTVLELHDWPARQQALTELFGEGGWQAQSISKIWAKVES